MDLGVYTILRQCQYVANYNWGHHEVISLKTTSKWFYVCYYVVTDMTPPSSAKRPTGAALKRTSARSSGPNCAWDTMDDAPEIKEIGTGN